MKAFLKHAFHLCLMSVLVLFGSIAFAAPAKADELPSFFPPGISQVKSPHEQWERYLEYLKATSVCHSPNENSPPVSYSGNMKIVRETFGKKVTYNFDAYRKEADGKIYYSDYCGRKLISEHQWKVDSEWMMSHVSEAVREDYRYYGGIEQAVVKLDAAMKKKPEADVRKELAQVVPELAQLSPPVTFRELQQMPAAPFAERDFVQTEVHFQHAPYFGAVWLNTELVFLTYQGMMFDYIVGKPVVAMHELVHGNEKFQDWVMSDMMDFELLASINMMLIPEEQMSLMFHSYAKEWREMIRVVFGFDFAQARKDIVVFNHDGANIRINTQKFDEYAGKLTAVKAAMLAHYRDRVLPELYRNQI